MATWFYSWLMHGEAECDVGECVVSKVTQLMDRRQSKMSPKIRYILPRHSPH
jgi:hypothetical protein